MAHKKLVPVIQPQLWYQTQPNGLVEAVVIERFGAGPASYRLWVPAGDDEKVRKAIVKRMASDYGIELTGWSRLMSNTNPLIELNRNKA